MPDSVAQRPTISVDAELNAPGIVAQIVRFAIPEPTATLHEVPDRYHVNMCLTPRPLNSRGGFRDRWGPHRFERLGDIFMLPPGEELYVKGESGRQASLICSIDPALVHEIVGRDLVWDDQHLAATLDISSAQVRALLFRITAEIRHPGLAATKMLELLGAELAIELGRYCYEVAERSVTGGLAGWRLRLIDERLADRLEAPSLKELAELCGLSVRQLTRGFRVSRACSIGDYIEQRRMEAAKRLLMEGESVKTIAFTMGFASPSSFTFAFRRAVGTSPTTFRQRQGRVLSTTPADAGY
ncbi:helix-turn-helix domain-containing protein [Novosphingobium mangrovi (ex Huang et al. 2023)]|uniref:Helix-turn-helix domain-containing protein n=1 Tax=Novosphingobium mangrovi (ex Huang et al. 2023) TaxID=2976432 RepID=A0ABT2I8A7_9SPHN|nr:helix-turn-helix domain-containing protein [Novosphingobium mangrovi (ex Huang et al. 2023)]MCT2401054.1 helix-turn-helix domain-containing protein [Novosphingobium mangrovi (ex Huang et al. 2023)]